MKPNARPTLVAPEDSLEPRRLRPELDVPERDPTDPPSISALAVDPLHGGPQEPALAAIVASVHAMEPGLPSFSEVEVSDEPALPSFERLISAPSIHEPGFSAPTPPRPVQAAPVQPVKAAPVQAAPMQAAPSPLNSPSTKDRLAASPLLRRVSQATPQPASTPRAAEPPKAAPAPPPKAAAPAIPPTPSHEVLGLLSPGHTLGDYRLESKIGEGGSASVWRATDVRLHMPIALKVFAPSQAGRATLRRVMREARAASKVVSDHVIRVKDAGYLEKADLGFIAMELCAAYPDPSELPHGAEPRLTVGRTLEQAPPATLEECLRLVAEAARGVADAHREGVFHRDIKPANILVRPGSRRAQITDFGLTVAELKGKGGSVRIPVAGARKRYIQGTPEYMPPEAAEGLPLDLDPSHDRALLTALDVYGLGATLYAILARDLPYRPHPAADSPVADVLRQVRAGPPPDLLDRPTPFPVPDHVARVVRKAMDPDPDARYDSAEALAEDLEALLDDRPTSLDEPFPVHRAKLHLRRNRLQVSAGVSVAVMIAAVFATLLIGVHLDAQVEVAEEQMRQLDAQRVAAQQRASRWEQEATTASERAQEARGEAEAALEIAALTESNLDAAKRRVMRLIHERDDARTEAETQQTRAETAETERDQVQSLAEQQTLRAEAAETDRDSAQETAKRQRQRAELAEAERDATQALADKERARAESAEAARDATQLELIEARRRATAEAAAHREAEADVANLTQELAASESSAQGLARQLSTMESLNEASKAEIAALRRKLAVLETTGAGE
ncbi:MAG: protein kinase [Alphaproteobacteria bacterium]|nr:protein kinase [Alphaproteobacteria bacterium]